MSIFATNFLYTYYLFEQMAIPKRRIAYAQSDLVPKVLVNNKVTKFKDSLIGKMRLALEEDSPTVIDQRPVTNKTSNQNNVSSVSAKNENNKENKNNGTSKLNQTGAKSGGNQVKDDKNDNSKKPVMLASRGKISSQKVLQMRATAYTHTGHRTCTGTYPEVGTIAVDPRVIPLGTKLYVDGYGFGTAQDTGGAIKGNIIDLFMETNQECIKWGNRKVTVYIIDN
jgi:3D (Asp-Asp-Asp) domain-containing protein